MGKKLTASLIFFLQEYLPQSFRADVPMLLIRSILPKQEADMVQPDDTKPPTWRNRAVVWLGLASWRWYYRITQVIGQAVPPARHILGSSFSLAGDALIDSWRDGLARRPFYIPDSASGDWQEQPQVTPSIRHVLRAWRLTLIHTIFKGLVYLISSTLASVVCGIWVAIYAMQHQTVWWLSCIYGAGSALLVLLLGWIFNTSILTKQVQRIVRLRPGPAEMPLITHA